MVSHLMSILFDVTDKKETINKNKALKQPSQCPINTFSFLSCVDQYAYSMLTNFSYDNDKELISE